MFSVFFFLGLIVCLICAKVKIIRIDIVSAAIAPQLALSRAGFSVAIFRVANLRSVRPIRVLHRHASNRPHVAMHVLIQHTWFVAPFGCRAVCKIWNTLDMKCACRHVPFYSCRLCNVADGPVIAPAIHPQKSHRATHQRKPAAFRDQLLL